MIRLNISFTDKDAKRLASERKATGVSTSALIRLLLDRYFTEKESPRKDRRRAP